MVAEAELEMVTNDDKGGDAATSGVGSDLPPGIGRPIGGEAGILGATTIAALARHIIGCARENA